MLSINHVEHLLYEGFTPSEIEALYEIERWRSFSELDAQKHSFVMSHPKHGKFSPSGLYMPFTESFGQLRLDEPVGNCKYLTPIGCKPQAYIPQGAIVIVEGRKDQALLSFRTKTPIGCVAGVTLTRKSLAACTNPITLAFDNDCWINPMLLKEVLTAAVMLKAQLAIVPVDAKLGWKAGWCEYFQYYSSDNALELFSNALSPDQWLLQAIEYFSLVSEKYKHKMLSVYGWAAESLFSPIIQEQVLMKLNRIPGVQSDTTTAVMQFKFDSQFAKREQLRIACWKPIAQAENLDMTFVVNGRTFEDVALTWILQSGSWRVYERILYKYNADLRYWEIIPEHIFLKLLTDTARCAVEILKQSKKEKVLLRYRFCTNNYIKSAASVIKSYLSTTVTPDQTVVAFKNCVWDFQKSIICKNAEKRFITSWFAATILEVPKLGEHAQCWLQGILFPNQIYQFRAYLSGMLDPTAPYGWFVELTGASGSGKGTFIKLLQTIFNHHTKSGGFEELETPEGRFQVLTPCKLYIIPDYQGVPNKLHFFYELVDNGALTRRALHSSAAWSAPTNTRFLIASTEPLKVSGADKGWNRRVRQLRFRSPPKIRDYKLLSKLREDLDSIVTWAIQMPKGLRDLLLANNSPPLVSENVQEFIEALEFKKTSASTYANGLYNAYTLICGGSSLVSRSALYKLITRVHHLEFIDSHWDHTLHCNVPSHWTSCALSIANIEILNYIQQGGMKMTSVNPTVLTISKALEALAFEFQGDNLKSMSRRKFQQLLTLQSESEKENLRTLVWQNLSQFYELRLHPMPKSPKAVIISEKTPELFSPVAETLRNLKEFAFDCETYGVISKKHGLDPLNGEIRLLQIASSKSIIVIDFGTTPELLLSLSDFQPVIAALEDQFNNPNVFKFAHNALFDLTFINNRLFSTQSARSIYCTYIGAQGIVGEYISTEPAERRKYYRPFGSYSLKSLALNLLGVTLDKSFQKTDWGIAVLSSDAITYAARDAWTTLWLGRTLRALLSSHFWCISRFSIEIWKEESEFLNVCTGMQEKGLSVNLKVSRAVKDSYEALKNRILDDWENLKLGFQYTNVAKLKAWLFSQGVTPTSMAREHIVDYQHYAPIKYRLILTGLDSVIHFTNSILQRCEPIAPGAHTGHARTHYRSVTATGRVASVVCKDYDSFVNLLRAPSKLPFFLNAFHLPNQRSQFSTPKGYKLTILDIPTSHARIAASVVNAERLLEFLCNSRDIHSFIASEIAKDLGYPSDTWTPEMIRMAAKNKDHPQHLECSKFRAVGKTTFFATLNGGSARSVYSTLKRDLGLTVDYELCEAAIEHCMNFMPELDTFGKALEQRALNEINRFPIVAEEFQDYFLYDVPGGHRLAIEIQPEYSLRSRLLAATWTSIEARIMKASAVKINRVLRANPKWDAHIALFMHDELVIQSQTSAAPIILALSREILTSEFCKRVTNAKATFNAQSIGRSQNCWVDV